MAKFGSIFRRAIVPAAIAWAVAAGSAHAQVGPSRRVTVGASATVLSPVAILSSRSIPAGPTASRGGLVSAVEVSSPAPHVVAAFEGDWTWAERFAPIRAGTADALPREVHVLADRARGPDAPARVTYVVAVVL